MLQRDWFNKPHLVFDEYSEKRLAECIEFVNTKRSDLEENFKSQFSWIHWGNTVGSRVRIMHDFAPLSFYFVKEVFVNGKWERDYNGGIIFHGAHDGGGNGGPPTFSVNLIPVDGWSTHT
jgi:hypothetical protein